MADCAPPESRNISRVGDRTCATKKGGGHTGPVLTGSANVLVNNRPVCRLTDRGKIGQASSPNKWEAIQGAPYVLINGLNPHRLRDEGLTIGESCRSYMVEGSPNVLVGDWGRGRPCGEEKTWVELEMVDVSDQPMAGLKYVLRLSDGTVRKGRLDDRGIVRVEHVHHGECTVSFPELWDGEWMRVAKQ